MRFKKLKQMVLASLFMALILLLGFTPLGMIPLPGIRISILALPVAVGALLMGWRWGVVFGACFAFSSLWNAFTQPSALVALLMAQSPVCVVLMSLLPRLLIGPGACLAYKLAVKAKPLVRSAIAGVAASLTNTIGYLGLMLVFFRLCGLDSTSVLALIGGTGLIGGGLEAAACAVIVPPVLSALFKLSHRKER
ncbi:MAG: ECF transporter S component [Clostridia bacterium]|nr:ECF transporter S component [Clostridia bacterium]